MKLHYPLRFGGTLSNGLAVFDSPPIGSPQIVLGVTVGDNEEARAYVRHLVHTANVCDGLAPVKVQEALNLVRQMARMIPSQQEGDPFDWMIIKARKLKLDEKEYDV